MSRDRLLETMARFPDALFAVDESFAELAGDEVGLIADEAPNLVVLRSLTKTWAVPGARVGFASASPELLCALRSELPSWPLSSFAQAIALHALRDCDFALRSADFVARAEADFSCALSALGGVKTYGSGANFMLLEFSSPEIGRKAARGLLRSGIAVRLFSEAEGLDGRFMRIAVRKPEENRLFAQSLAIILGGRSFGKAEAQ
jgi:histidinol-phosphate/aromatic aminotransferase/cobyric acid decarboxylase-like protein